MSGRARRWLVWSAVVVVLVVLIVIAVRPGTVEVETATVSRGELTVTLDREGTTRVRDRFVVAAPVGGQLERITLEPGTAVTAGETVVARVAAMSSSLLPGRDRRQAEAALRSARAALAQARADRAAREAEARFAAAELQRYRRLVAAGVETREKGEGVEAAAASVQQRAQAAEAGVEAALAELERAQAALIEPAGDGGGAGDGRALVAVRAPADGVVLRRLRESAGPVAAGDPLLEVGDPGRLEVVADYLSTDAVRIAPGMPATVDGWGGDTALHGRVRLVEPSGTTKVSALGVDEQRVDVVLTPDDEPGWDQLGDRFRVEVHVQVWHGDDVVRVPAGAMFRGEDGGWEVFVADGDHARRRQITVGECTQLACQVTDGLAAGDEVVLHPPDALADHSRIHRLQP